jgi:hypothetical protein
MLIKKVNTFILIVFLMIKNINSDEIIFEKFHKDSLENWQFISDQVMGGVSFGEFQIISRESFSYLRMTGFVSLENNGGFIQVRKKIDKLNNKKFQEIKLKCRGNNNQYFIHIRTKFTILPWQYYQLGFFVSDSWNEIKLDLNDFKRSGKILPKSIKSNHITSIALVAFGKQQRVNLEVSEIIFY